MVPTTQVPTALNIVQANMRQLGLKLNDDKTALVSRGPPHPNYPTFYKDNHHIMGVNHYTLQKLHDTLPDDAHPPGTALDPAAGDDVLARGPPKGGVINNYRSTGLIAAPKPAIH